MRFVEHLPRDGNEELTLLKGHLLVEEQLTALIHRATKRPEFLPKLRFADKARLARAGSSQADEEWIWTALAKLNAARNELSHTLAKDEFAVKLEAFISWVEEKKEKPKVEALSDRFGRLHWTIFYVHSTLAAEAHFDASKLRIKTLLSG